MRNPAVYQNKHGGNGKRGEQEMRSDRLHKDITSPHPVIASHIGLLAYHTFSAIQGTRMSVTKVSFIAKLAVFWYCYNIMKVCIAIMYITQLCILVFRWNFILVMPNYSWVSTINKMIIIIIECHESIKWKVSVLLRKYIQLMLIALICSHVLCICRFNLIRYYTVIWKCLFIRYKIR